MRKAFSILVLIVVALVSIPTTSVDALFINIDNKLLNSVTDTFSSIRTPNPNKNWDYWWRTLNTIVPAAGRVENKGCSGGPNGDANCVLAMSEGWNDFARFRLRPGKQPGEFYQAQLSDIRDSSPQSTPKRWKAKPGKPVIMTGRVRFSENYKPEGTDANGTAGFGLWNMPTETLDEFPYIELHPQRLFGSHILRLNL